MIIYIFLKVFYRLKVIGLENVPDKGGVIIAANHVSYLDPPAIGVALKRQATYMAREGLFKIPVVGAFVKLFSFPVRRDKPQPSTIKEAVKRLRKGELIVMFPEGSRSADGKPVDVKRGIGIITTMSRVPIVPAFINGTEKALPVGAKFLRPAKITITFGHPVEIEREETNKNMQEKISMDIMQAIKNLKFKEQIKNYGILLF
ncbi:MAG: lysophospholipid acyltransferase family protein [Nitrospirota bacterium]